MRKEEMFPSPGECKVISPLVEQLPETQELHVSAGHVSPLDIPHHFPPEIPTALGPSGMMVSLWGQNEVGGQ